MTEVMMFRALSYFRHFFIRHFLIHHPDKASNASVRKDLGQLRVREAGSGSGSPVAGLLVTRERNPVDGRGSGFVYKYTQETVVQFDALTTRREADEKRI
jgi:hypothetical protein